MTELYMLWQSNSAVSCLRLAFALLQRCPQDAPASLVADLIECVRYSTGHLGAVEEALPRLRTAADARPEDGNSQADLAIALGALDETGRHWNSIARLSTMKIRSAS